MESSEKKDGKYSVIGVLVPWLMIVAIVFGIAGFYLGKYYADLACVDQLKTVANSCLDMVNNTKGKIDIDNESKIRSECSKEAAKAITMEGNFSDKTRIEAANVLYKTCLVGRGMKSEDLY